MGIKVEVCGHVVLNVSLWGGGGGGVVPAL